LLDEATALYRQLGDGRGVGRALTYRAILYTYAGDPPAARTCLLEGLQLLRDVDDRWGLALAGSNLAAVTRMLGDPDEAHRLLEEYVALARQTGDRYLLGSALPKWVHIAIARGVPDQAEAYVQEALGLFRVFNDGWWTARCLNLLTVMAAERGDHLRAARLLGAAEHLLDQSGARLVPTDEARSARMCAMLGTQLGEEQFDAARAEGRRAPVEQIVQYAMDTAAVQLGPVTAGPSPDPVRH
jgi:non-specific serine/threonine protein kinase